MSQEQEIPPKPSSGTSSNHFYFSLGSPRSSRQTNETVDTVNKSKGVSSVGASPLPYKRLVPLGISSAHNVRHTVTGGAQEDEEVDEATTEPPSTDSRSEDSALSDAETDSVSTAPMSEDSVETAPLSDDTTYSPHIFPPRTPLIIDTFVPSFSKENESIDTDSEPETDPPDSNSQGEPYAVQESLPLRDAFIKHEEPCFAVSQQQERHESPDFIDLTCDEDIAKELQESFNQSFEKEQRKRREREEKDAQLALEWSQKWNDENFTKEVTKETKEEILDGLDDNVLLRQDAELARQLSQELNEGSSSMAGEQAFQSMMDSASLSLQNSFIEKDTSTPRALVRDKSVSPNLSARAESLNRSYSFVENRPGSVNAINRRAFSLETTLKNSECLDEKGKASVWDNLAQLNAKFDSACRKKKKAKMSCGGSSIPLSSSFSGDITSFYSKKDEDDNDLIFMGSTPSKGSSLPGEVKKETQKLTVVDITGDVPRVIRPHSSIKQEKSPKVSPTDF